MLDYVSSTACRFLQPYTVQNYEGSILDPLIFIHRQNWADPYNRTQTYFRSTANSCLAYHRYSSYSTTVEDLPVCTTVLRVEGSLWLHTWPLASPSLTCLYQCTEGGGKPVTSHLTSSLSLSHLSVPLCWGWREACDLTPDLQPLPLSGPHLSRATSLDPHRRNHWTVFCFVIKKVHKRGAHVL